MIKSYISEHRNEIVDTLCEMIRIPSVADTKESKRMLKHVVALYEKNGFEAELFDTYALSYFGDFEKSIGMFAHSDVVAAQNDWIYGSAYEPTVSNGVLFGRGSLDNKAAIALSLYALKIIKELEIPFNSRLICFTGSNEEASMSDIRDYLKSHTPPTFSLVLDAAFPIYLGDKGMLWLDCTLNKPLEDLISISGGSAVNIILGSALARVKYSEKLLSELNTRDEISVKREGNEIEMCAQGISAHGANPEGTKNAAGIIIKALLEAEKFSSADKEALSIVSELLNTYDGAPLGISSCDDLFGSTTVSNGIISVENGKLRFTLDIRYGNTYTQEGLIKTLKNALSPYGIEFKILKDGEPRAISADNKYVKACMRAYREFTSDSNSKERINKGGTYSRYLPCAAEIGTTLKWDAPPLPSGHGQAHQSDEHINIEGMLEALELVVKMLIECDRENNK